MVSKSDTTKRAPSKRERGTRAGTNPGRYSNLTITRCKNIVGAIQMGNYVVTACEYAGIGRATYYGWVNRGEVELDRVHSLPRTNLEDIMNQFDGKDPNDIDDKTGMPKDKGTVEYMWAHRPRQFDPVEWPYVVFNHLVERAQAAAEVRAVANVMAAGQTQWQAAMTWLERTRPERYGRKDQVQHTGVQGGAPIRTETVVTVNQLMERLGELGLKVTEES